jgi:hypothetical protein
MVAVVVAAAPRGAAAPVAAADPAAGESPRVLISFFLAGSFGPAGRQLRGLDFLAGARAAAGAAGAAGTRRLRRRLVQRALDARLGGFRRLGDRLGFRRLGGTSTFLGADIMERIAAASASALRRRSPRSRARAASSSARAFDSAAAFSRASAAALSRASACALATACAASASAALAAVAPSLACEAASTSRRARSASAARASSAARSRASCSSRSRRLAASSSSWRRISSAWRRASSSRRASSASSGPDGMEACAGSGASTTAVSEPSSRLMKVRFLRTSTWIVRALARGVGLLDLAGGFLHQRDLLALGRGGAVAGLEVTQQLLLVGVRERSRSARTWPRRRSSAVPAASRSIS